MIAEVRADDDESRASANSMTKGQFHVRLGMVSGSFSGQVEGAVSNSNSLEVEYEFFRSEKRSLFIDAILAMDISLQQPVYSYVGTGYRYYFGSKAISYTGSNEGGSISSKPRFRYYCGLNLGVSEVLVKFYGDILSVTSSVLELGGHVGAIYQVGNNFGLELNAGYGMGFGFSYVSEGTTLMKVFLGGVIYF